MPRKKSPSDKIPLLSFFIQNLKEFKFKRKIFINSQLKKFVSFEHHANNMSNIITQPDTINNNYQPRLRIEDQLKYNLQNF